MAPSLADGAASHYAADAKRAVGASAAATLPAWDRVDSEIAFTARDAVAVVRWTTAEPGTARSEGRLLLLRAVDDRWLIYRESAL